MNRDLLNEDLIELGVVSADTKGSFVGRDDHEGGLRIRAGLADD